MSFIYPRIIAVTRPEVSNAVGALPYSAALEANETPVASNLPASIQHKKDGRKPDADLPNDVSKLPYYNIFIPLNAAALGLIQRRDIITDDLGIRYQVQSPYWNSLGYNLFCEELEV